MNTHMEGQATDDFLGLGLGLAIDDDVGKDFMSYRKSHCHHNTDI